MSFRWWPAAAVLAAVGCFAYRPSTLTPEPGSRVRIILASPSLITTVADDTVRHTYAGVLEASGIVQAASRDTLAVRLGELRTVTSAVDSVADQVALLPTASVARIEQRRFQAGTTALAGIGFLTLALSAYLILLITVITRAAV